MATNRDDIVKIAKHGDQKAFKRMFQQFHGKLLGLAQYYVHSNEIAEEVVGDVWVKVWDKRKSLARVKKMEAYLYVLVKNHALNQLRSATRYRFMTIDKIDLEIKVTSRNPEEQLLSKEIMTIFEQSVAALPQKCNLVYRMVKDDGLSYKEVAKILNISVKMVEKHIGTALKRLRKDMDYYTNKSEINLKNLIYTAIILLSMLILL